MGKLDLIDSSNALAFGNKKGFEPTLPPVGL
jgi:hypothetical protein